MNAIVTVLLMPWIFLESSVFTDSEVLQDVVLWGCTDVLCVSARRKHRTFPTSLSYKCPQGEESQKKWEFPQSLWIVANFTMLYNPKRGSPQEVGKIIFLLAAA